MSIAFFSPPPQAKVMHQLMHRKLTWEPCFGTLLSVGSDNHLYQWKASPPLHFHPNAHPRRWSSAHEQPWNNTKMSAEKTLGALSCDLVVAFAHGAANRGRGAFQIEDIAAGAKRIYLRPEHANTITDMVCIAEKDLVVTSSLDRRVCVWQVTSRRTEERRGPLARRGCVFTAWRVQKPRPNR